MEGGEKALKNDSKLEKSMTIFLGHAKKSGATREELDTIIATIGLIRKYLPFSKSKKES